MRQGIAPAGTLTALGLSALNAITGGHAWRAEAVAQSVACSTGVPLPDTVRLTGVTNANRQPGTMTLWRSGDGGFHYSESWRVDTVTHTWEGTVHFRGDGLPSSFSARRTRNGAIGTNEHAEQLGDSLITTRDGKRAAAPMPGAFVPVPSVRTTAVLALLMQCAASQKQHEFRTSALGVVRATVVGSAPLRGGEKTVTAELYVLSSDSISQLAVVWLHAQSHRLLAARGGDGNMDFVAKNFEAVLPELVTAELRAAQPPRGPATCAGGNGPGSCEPIGYACTVTPRRNLGRNGGTLVLSDSGYSITSDGRGPYRDSDPNVTLGASPTFAVLNLQAISRGQRRAINIDLNHPVPGDIGKPLGVIQADGAWLGPFVPAGGQYRVELVAQTVSAEVAAWAALHPKATIATLDSLLIRNPSTYDDIPVGATAPAYFLGVGFYANGLHHVLQMGPVAWGTCSTDRNTIYGDGTTTGTISRQSATRWVVDLPPGSVGRLFDEHLGEAAAVNKGLYHVSLHFVIQQ
jgi:hypothetical protein